MAHRAHTVHHVRGRIRLKVPHAKGNPQLVRDVQQAIAAMEGVTRVEAKPTTGSVVVHYDPALHDDFHERLSAHCESGGGGVMLEPPDVSEVDELARKIEAEAVFLSEHSDTARVIVNQFKRLDQGIKHATDNAVDLKVLLPLGLAAYSFFEVGLEASTPLWVTLGIFSFNSFVQLHSHPASAGTTHELVVNPPEAAPSKSS